MPRPDRFWLGAIAGVASCAAPSPSVSAPTSTSRMPAAAPSLVEEQHLADVRQLTKGGENAEAYWSFDGRELILQSRAAMAGCDRIFRMPAADDSAALV